MALSLLLWWIPVFFVTGVLIGVILQIVMPTYERGGMQILGLLALAVFTVVVVSVLTAVIRSIEPEPTADVVVPLRRSMGILLFAPFLFGVLTGRFAKRRARVSRRRRIVGQAGTHYVPDELRPTVERPTSVNESDPVDRPLPTPFGVGGRDPSPTTNRDGPSLPPPGTPGAPRF